MTNSSIFSDIFRKSAKSRNERAETLGFYGNPNRTVVISQIWFGLILRPSSFPNDSNFLVLGLEFVHRRELARQQCRQNGARLVGGKQAVN
jgi:hypothetical protein